MKKRLCWSELPWVLVYFANNGIWSKNINNSNFYDTYPIQNALWRIKFGRKHFKEGTRWSWNRPYILTNKLHHRKCFVRILVICCKTVETHSFTTLTRSFLKFCNSWIKICIFIPRETRQIAKINYHRNHALTSTFVCILNPCGS